MEECGLQGFILWKEKHAGSEQNLSDRAIRATKQHNHVSSVSKGISAVGQHLKSNIASKMRPDHRSLKTPDQVSRHKDCGCVRDALGIQYTALHGRNLSVDFHILDKGFQI